MPLYSSIMASSWLLCDTFNRTYAIGTCMALMRQEEPPVKVTIIGEAFALANGNPVVPIKEQNYPVCINQLESVTPI